MNKKREKMIIFCTLIFLFLISFALSWLNQRFGDASVWFLVSSITFISYCRALNPQDRVRFVSNLLKERFQRKNQLERYQKITHVIWLVSAALGGVTIVRAILGVIFMT